MIIISSPKCREGTRGDISEFFTSKTGSMKQGH
jgi:hypothetical protein